MNCTQCIYIEEIQPQMNGMDTDEDEDSASSLPNAAKSSVSWDQVRHRNKNWEMFKCSTCPALVEVVASSRSAADGDFPLLSRNRPRPVNQSLCP